MKIVYDVSEWPKTIDFALNGMTRQEAHDLIGVLDDAKIKCFDELKRSDPESSESRDKTRNEARRRVIDFLVHIIIYLEHAKEGMPFGE